YANVEANFLSMGMSNDYVIAIEEGANMIRIGTKIYGDRNK
ncbi:MAG TPA: YggS family pyridoxal phosphate-dependent enzyme, partial [Clostridiales bacterium UBA8960]|nr:YggS family pyridoxal phosphate-dependent enzyme [Clostridiales bacterium UBA8960]